MSKCRVDRGHDSFNKCSSSLEACLLATKHLPVLEAELAILLPIREPSSKSDREEDFVGALR